MSEIQILFFVLTSVVIILTPGQDMVLVMSRGITQGASAGIVTAAGVSTGLLGHTALAGIGLGALLMASEPLFTVLKIIGAAYLIYLGLRLLITRVNQLDVVDSEPVSLKKLFSVGALSNLSNPKITLFYFAFLPQFVPAGIHNPAPLILMLGAGFALLTFLIKAPIGYFSGLASAWIRSRSEIVSLINRVSGTVLIGLGLKLAF